MAPKAVTKEEQVANKKRLQAALGGGARPKEEAVQATPPPEEAVQATATRTSKRPAAASATVSGSKAPKTSKQATAEEVGHEEIEVSASTEAEEVLFYFVYFEHELLLKRSRRHKLL